MTSSDDGKMRSTSMDIGAVYSQFTPHLPPTVTTVMSLNSTFQGSSKGSGDRVPLRRKVSDFSLTQESEDLSKVSQDLLSIVEQIKTPSSVGDTVVSPNMLGFMDSVDNVSNITGMQLSSSLVELGGDVANSAMICIPELIQLSTHSPVHGSIAVAILMFYNAVRDATALRDHIGELVKSITDSLKWFRDTSRFLKHVSKDVVLAGHINSLLDVIMKAKNYLNKWKRLSVIEKNVFDNDHKNTISKFVAESLISFQNISDSAKRVIYETNRNNNTKFIAERFGHNLLNLDEDIDFLFSRYTLGTKEWLHSIVDVWFESLNSRALSIVSDAGLGKSTFAASLILLNRCRETLLASYMFKFNDCNRSNGDAFILNIASQIANRIPESRDDIFRGIKYLNGDPLASLNEKLSVLVIQPLSCLVVENPQNGFMIIVDALDEVGTKGSRERATILSLLNTLSMNLPPWVKLLVTSRQDDDIFTDLNYFKLVKIESSDTRLIKDNKYLIESIFRGKLRKPSDMKRVVDLILERSGNLPLYISLLPNLFEVNKIEKWLAEEIENEFPCGLSQIFLRFFDRFKNPDALYFENIMKPLLFLIIAMREPLSFVDAHNVAKISMNDVIEASSRLRPLFITTGTSDDNRCFQVIHRSIIDWLTDPIQSRCINSKGNISIYWLQKISPHLEYDSLVTIYNGFQNLKLRRFQNLALFDDTEWERTCDQIALLYQIIRPIKKFFRERENPFDFSNEMLYDYFLDIEQGHNLFCHGFLSYVQGYEKKSFTCQMIFSTIHLKEYFFKHLIFHLVFANRNDEAKVLLSRLPWLSQYVRKERFVSLEMNYFLVSSLSKSDDVDLDKDITLIHKALRLSLSDLNKVRNEDDLVSNFVLHLIGRLRSINRIRQKSKKVNSALNYLMQECEKWWKSGKSLFPVMYELPAPGGPLETSLFGHTAHVTAVVALSDGRLVSGSFDKVIRIWNPTSNECEKQLHGHAGEVTSLTVLRDGKIVSGSRDNTIRIWNPNSGDCVRTLDGHASFITSLCVLNNGNIVSGSYDKTIRIWNPTRVQCERILHGHTRRVAALTVLSDGNLASGGFDNSVRLWDTSSGDCLKILLGHTNWVVSLTELPNGKLASGSFDKLIRIWNVKSGECERILKGHASAVAALTRFDDCLVSGSYDKTIRVWDQNLDDYEVLEGHHDGVTSLTTFGDGKIASSSNDRTIKVWNRSLDDYEKIAPFATSFPINCICILNDGRVVTSSNDKTIRVWNPTSGDCEKTLEGLSYPVSSLSVLRDNRILSGSNDGTIRIWNLITDDCERILEGHCDVVTSLALLNDGSIVSGSSTDDRSIRLWSPMTGQCKRIIEGHESGVKALRVLHDDRIVSCSIDKSIRIWNATTGECLSYLLGHTGSVTALSITDNYRIVSGSADKSIRLWDPITGKCDEILDYDSYIYLLGGASFSMNSALIECNISNVNRVFCSTNGSVAIGTSKGSLYVFASI